MRNGSSLLAVLAAASLSGVVLMNVAPALAQGIGGNNIAALDYNQTDVREALRNLFKMSGVSYTIAPDIQGTVTLSLRNVPFDTALQNLTRQVDATYRIEGGVYQIVPQEENPSVREQLDKAKGESFMLVDGNTLFVLKGNVVYKLNKTTMTVMSSARLK